MTLDSTNLSATSPASRPKVSFERERGVYAIQVTRDLAQAVVSVDTGEARSAQILKVFHTLTEAEVAIFMIKLHRTAVSFVLAGGDIPRAVTAFEAAGFRARTRHDLAMVVVKAASMRDVSGIMVDIADALYDAGALLYGTGDSHDSVQCLIESARVDPATERLRATFSLESEAVQEHPLDAEGTR